MSISHLNIFYSIFYSFISNYLFLLNYKKNINIRLKQKMINIHLKQKMIRIPLKITHEKHIPNQFLELLIFSE